MRYMVLCFSLYAATENFASVIFSSGQEYDKGCQPEVDVIFLLDGSDSISNTEFSQQQRLVEHFVHGMNTGSGIIRLGVIVVSSSIGGIIPLKGFTNMETYLVKIQNLSHPQEGSRTELGLKKMQEMFDQEGRKGVYHMGVVLSDGGVKYPHKTQEGAEMLKKSGVQIISIGVGRIVEEVKLMALANTALDYCRFGSMLETLKLINRKIFSLRCKENLQKEIEIRADSFDRQMTTAAFKESRQIVAQTPAALSWHVAGENPLELGNLRLESSTVTSSTRVSSEHVNFVSSNIKKTDENMQYNVPKISSGANEEPTSKIRFHLLQKSDSQQSVSNLQISDDIRDIGVDKRGPSYKRPDVNSTSSNIFDHSTNWQRYRDSSRLNLFWGQLKQPTKLFDVNIPLIVPVSVVGKVSHAAHVALHVPRPAKHQWSLLKDAVSPLAVDSESTFIKRKERRSSENNPEQPLLPNLVSHHHHHGDHGHSETTVCSGSRFVEGVGYTSTPSSCNEFIQCFYEETLRVEKARCPFKMFWDQSMLLCRPSNAVFCWRDPCFDYTVRSYPYSSNCRAYWTCDDGLSRPKCCPMGFSYSEIEGCARNVSCVEHCEDEIMASSNIISEDCRMTPLETNHHFYFEKISEFGMMVRACPKGSRFDPEQCACDRTTSITETRCEPELVLDFDDGVFDKSGHNLALMAHNIILENGAGYFNGTDSKITIWRFASLSFGQQFTVTLKYKELHNSKSSQTMHILSNCCCGGNIGPSVDISVVTNETGGEVDLLGETWIEKTAVNISYHGHNWKNITYIYDGKNLTGRVNEHHKAVLLSGHIGARTSALTIGSCGSNGGFTGWIDEVRIYLCIPEGML